MPKQKRPLTWIELAVVNAGMRTAFKAINWAHSWAVARESLGHDPTVEEVADWWNMSRRTAFRDQAAFREAFPTLADPSPMYASEEARAAIAKQAAFGDRMDKWAADRRAKREAEAMRAALGNVD